MMLDNMNKPYTIKINGVFVLIAVVILGTLMYTTIRRNQVWRGGPISVWSDSVSKSPLKTRPRINLARSYQEFGMDDDAMHEYAQASMIAMLPETTPRERIMTRQLAAMNMSQILLKYGDLVEAERVLVKVWNEEPGFPGIALNLSIVYMNMGNHQFAKEVLDAGIENIPNYPWFQYQGRLYFNRGITKQFLGDCDGALEDFRYIAMHRPDADLPAPPVCQSENKP